MILGYLEREKCKDDRLYALQFASDIDVDMTSLIQAGKTKQGRSAIIDNQHFSYVSNGPGSQKVYNWRCSNRKCDATLGNKEIDWKPGWGYTAKSPTWKSAEKDCKEN